MSSILKPVIIIPCYNSEVSISLLIKKIKTLVTIPIIVINDGSEDNTAKLLKSKDVTVINHRINLGVGASIKNGINIALKNSFTHAITIDSDGQHNPKYIPEFLNKIETNDFIIGNRFSCIKYIPSCKIAANMFASLLINSLFKSKLLDVTCGFRGFKLDSNILTLNSNGFDFLYEHLIYNIVKDYKIVSIEIDSIYNICNLLNTRFKELNEFASIIFKYTNKNHELYYQLKSIIEQIRYKNDFKFKFPKNAFYAFFLNNYDAYIFQTDLKQIEEYHALFNCDNS